MKIRNEIKAGAFLLAALILFGLCIWTLGSDRQLFAKQVEFFSYFTDVKGLAEGAPVRLGGISIGRVSEIDFAEKGLIKGVQVRLLINTRYLPHIRKDSLVTIETHGLLGDRFVTLLHGSEDAADVGSILRSREASDISEVLAKAARVVDNTTEISEHLKKFLETFRTETLQHITDASKSISTLAKEIENGKGLLHRLVYSEKDGDSIFSSLKGAADDIKKITNEIGSGDGILHALIYGEGGKDTVTAFLTAGQNIAAISESIKTGNGLLHDLVFAKSPEGLNAIIEKLNDTASNLRSAARALAGGSGTLGALLVDSQLYDNLVEVTDGAKRSIILRHAIRSSLAK